MLIIPGLTRDPEECSQLVIFTLDPRFRGDDKEEKYSRN